MVTVKVGVVSLPRLLENIEEVIGGNLRFKIVCNSHYITIRYIGMLSWQL